MTWSMQNPKSKPADRVYVISLKLHDYTKSPSGEREVKFHLNKDTLESMLTSMTYINNQLANSGGPSAGPFQKRPRIKACEYQSAKFRRIRSNNNGRDVTPLFCSIFLLTKELA